MFCPDCGQDNPGEARFCRACGSGFVATAEAPPSSVYRTPAPSAVTAQAADVSWPGQRRAFGYWASKALAIAIGLLTVVILVGSYLFGLFIAGLGACLWGGVTGKWPGTRLRVNPVVRVALGLILIAANGFVAVISGYLAGGTCEIFCGRMGLAAGVGIGLGVFVGAAAIEALAILLVLGAIKLIRRLWRQADTSARHMSLRAGER